MEKEPAPVPPAKEEKPADKAQPVKDGVLYGIQVLATGKDMDLKDPYFLGYQPMVVPSGKLKKYVICTSASLS